MSNYHTVILFYGFAESGSSACLVMSVMNPEVVFETPEVAVRSLAAELYAKFRYDHVRVRPQPCCAKMDSTDNYCRVCGTHKTARDGFDRSGFEEFVISLFTTDADSWGTNAYDKDDYTTDDDAQWMPRWPDQEVLANPKGFVKIFDYGERALTEALGTEITGIKKEDQLWFPGRITD